MDAAGFVQRHRPIQTSWVAIAPLEYGDEDYACESTQYPTSAVPVFRLFCRLCGFRACTPGRTNTFFCASDAAEYDTIQHSCGQSRGFNQRAESIIRQRPGR